MAIKVPGVRSRNGHVASSKRSAVAVLQLTAMVDLFTVMVVFLLQNYATTQQILPLPDAVELPAATTVKELKPSNVVILDNEEVRLNTMKITDFRTVKEQEDWNIEPLKVALEEMIRKGEEQKTTMRQQIRDAVTEAREGEPIEEEVDDFRKITIQADRAIDFLTVKKVMFTVTEAGVQEINFAVLKRDGKNSL